MPDFPPANDDLTKLVPQGLLRRLKAHFGKRIEEVVQRYRFNDADEVSPLCLLDPPLEICVRHLDLEGILAQALSLESKCLR